MRAAGPENWGPKRLHAWPMVARENRARLPKRGGLQRRGGCLRQYAALPFERGPRYLSRN
jgi:hypothetical protein